MKAAYIEQTGPPETIRYGDLPVPEVHGTEVLVKVAAVSVNPVDTYIRGGAHYWKLPQPFVLGCDLAGVVEAVGPESQKYQPGDRVWCTNQGLVGRQGTFAEYAAVDECWLYPIPEGVEDETVAACSLVGVTAHLGLFGKAQIQAGDTIFVHGGTGGVGSMVIQMAKIAGARVITTGATAAKVARCKELGADVAINYKTEDVAAALADFAPDGVDIFWETLREPNFDQIVNCMAERGRIVLIAGRETRPEFPVRPFYVKALSMFGVVMFKVSSQEMRPCGEDINRWLAEKKLRANISKILPLSATATAHRLQEENTLGKAGTLAGKIVLRTSH
ncbi:MAG: NADPH:quinone reductase [Pirellulaceae bacterium]|nr:NADPH:quinone reductase [Pirellulaceae bacterium]